MTASESIGNCSKGVHAWDQAFSIIARLSPLLMTDHAGEAPRITPDFLHTLRHYGLSPLVFRELTRHGYTETLDPDMLQLLRDDYVNAVRAAHEEELQIRELLQALQQAGIKPLLLKGADIRHRIYGDPALRHMVDLDFMISRSTVTRVKEVLEQLGYRLNCSTVHPSEEIIDSFGFELCFTPPPAKALLIEPHWEIGAAACLYRLPYDELVTSAQDMRCYGTDVQVLSPEHLIMHLCLHLYGDYGNFDYGDHSYVSPRHIIDILLALDRMTINWDIFLAEAIRLGCAYPAYVVLVRVKSLAPSSVPEKVLAVLSLHRPSWRQWATLKLRDTLRSLSRHAPGLHRYYRIWETFTYAMTSTRTRKKIIKGSSGGTAP